MCHSFRCSFDVVLVLSGNTIELVTQPSADRNEARNVFADRVAQMCHAEQLFLATYPTHCELRGKGPSAELLAKKTGHCPPAE